MPSGLPEIDESYTDEEIIEHPVIELLMTESEWLSELWPIFSRLVGFDLVELTSEPEGLSLVRGIKTLL